MTQGLPNGFKEGNQICDGFWGMGRTQMAKYQGGDMSLAENVHNVFWENKQTTFG